MNMLLPKYYGPRIGRLKRLSQVTYEHQQMIREMKLLGYVTTRSTSGFTIESGLNRNHH